MKKIIINLIGPFIIIFVLVFITYKDFYGIEIVGKTIRTNILSITNSKEQEKIYNISIENELPLTDQEGVNKEPYTLKIKNTNKYDLNYTIYLKEDQTMEELDGCNNRLLNLNNIKYSINDTIGIIEQKQNNNYIIYNSTLKPNEKKEFKIRIWIDKNTNITTDNKHIHFKVYTTQNKNNIKLINELKNKATNNENYYVDTDEAKNMYQINNKYVYIGNIPNNYIYFNCKNSNLSSCELWRIVSIEKVLLNSLKEENRIKIVRNNPLQQQVKYQNINYEINNNKIEKVILNKDPLYKETNYGILTMDDYRNSFSKGFEDACFNNIYKCEKNSYLTSNKNEWLNMDKKEYIYISRKGNVITTSNDSTNYYRPVVYLKEKIKLMGGDGSKELPYIIK